MGGHDRKVEGVGETPFAAWASRVCPACAGGPRGDKQAAHLAAAPRVGQAGVAGPLRGRSR